MCQEEILNYLKKRKRPVDIRELLINIKANRASISRGCRRLRETKEVKYRRKKVGSYIKYIYYPF